MPGPGGRATLSVTPEAIVFDCDGVLIDSDASVVAAWTAWALARDLDPADVIAVCHGQPARATVRAFVDEAGADAALADIDRLELELAGEARALPGALELLRTLPEGRWGLCTSGNRALATARIAASGIELPAVFVTADDVERGKPDPEGYALALARLGASPVAIRGRRGRAERRRRRPRGRRRDRDRGGGAGGRGGRRCRSSPTCVPWRGTASTSGSGDPSRRG